jgi:hypothetical protein
VLGLIALAVGTSVAEGPRYFTRSWCSGGDVLFHGGECYIFIDERVSGWAGNRLQELLLLKELFGFQARAELTSNVSVHHFSGGKIKSYKVSRLSWDAGFFPFQGVPCRMSADGDLCWKNGRFEPIAPDQIAKRNSYKLLSDLLAAEGWSKYEGVPNYSRERESTYTINLTGGQYALKVTKHESSGYVKSFVLFGPGLSPDGETLGKYDKGDWAQTDKRTYRDSFPE